MSIHTVPCFMLYYNPPILIYRAGAAAPAPDDAAAAATAATAPGIGRGTALLGLFRSSIVIPSNFVMPTTGASPFFTNSYMPG